MAVVVMMVMIVVVVAVRTVNVGLLGHCGLLRKKTPGIISPLRGKCRWGVKNNPGQLPT